ncbi:hypothetical protein B0H14DRAFT_2640123 [Mycena olivaceomarginata]|nr:hypothetical protein B0H14DRAFT_2640123 [Mycena olivaceomarginata]
MAQGWLPSEHDDDKGTWFILRTLACFSLWFCLLKPIGGPHKFKPPSGKSYREGRQDLNASQFLESQAKHPKASSPQEFYIPGVETYVRAVIRKAPVLLSAST